MVPLVRRTTLDDNPCTKDSAYKEEGIAAEVGSSHFEDDSRDRMKLNFVVSVREG